MIGIAFTLQLLEPVLANSLAGDENSARSLAFIPGSLIRGALIAAYLRGMKVVQGDAMDPSFRSLFLSGQTRFLSAYPLIDGSRSLPVPLGWRVRKDEAAGSETVATDIYNLCGVMPVGPDLKPVTFDFWVQRGTTAYSQDISFRLNVHTERDALFGRAREGAGAIFRYEALPAGLLLRSAILTENEGHTNDLKALLEEGELLIGKARAAGYGRVRVQNLELLPKDWREGWDWEVEEDEDHDLQEASSAFTLTFLSPCLIRDCRGQWTIDPIPALEEILNTAVKSIWCARSVEIVGGFNRTWGLPFPQIPAIEAGSTFYLSTESPASLASLRRLEEYGIGERRAEGFGRVTIDLRQPDRIQWRKMPAEVARPINELEVELSQPAEAMGTIMLTRLLRHDLDLRVMESVHDNIINGDDIPNSQLSRWRILLTSALAEPSPENMLERVTTFFASERKKRSPAWKRLKRARIGSAGQSKRLTEWMDDVLTNVSSPWEQMGYDKAPERRLGGRLSVKADRSLAIEYRIRLILGVFTAKAREQSGNREASRNG